LTVAGVDRFWYARGLEWIRDHPRDASALYLRKLVFFWNGFEIPNNRDFRDQARRFTPILQGFLVQYSILLPFALFGLIRGGGDRRAKGLLIAFLAAWTVSVAAFFVCTRFRLPAVPWVLPFGAAGVLAFAGDLRRAGTAPGPILRAGALLVALFALTNGMVVSRSGLADVTSQRDAPFHRYNLAVLYERQGDLDRAITEYRAAVAARSSDPRVHLNLGNLLARTGRHADARTEYHRVIRMAPSFEPAARANLGILATQEEDWSEAVRQFQRVLEVDPGQPSALVGLAAAYLSAGRFDEAVTMHRRALAAEAAPEGALRRSLGVAYLELGLLEEAEQESMAALRFDPEDIVAILTLGRIHRFRGDEESAERMWARARQVAPHAPAVERAIEEAERVDVDAEE
jgi:Flp pilus assembly protein TadD